MERKPLELLLEKKVLHARHGSSRQHSIPDSINVRSSNDVDIFFTIAALEIHGGGE
jgi:hypothetical protein